MSPDKSTYELNRPVSYTLRLDDDLLATTKEKLQLARYPEEQIDLASDDWSQGAKVDVVKKLAEYWQNGYDWRAEEAKINKDFEQYMVKIDIPDYGPQLVHYAHHPSSNPNAIPLLIVHGWPGSFLETRKVIDTLVNPSSDKEQAFHVIVPSLPGYGPGSPPQKSGFGPVMSAKAFKVLMVDVLGYDKFLTQGGDWGAIVTRSMAMQFPQNVKACHSNFFPHGPPPFYKAPRAMVRLVLNSYLYTDKEKQALANMKYFQDEQSGYLIQQSTRPQSLGFALGDSPIGLLAWFVEKYHEWIDVKNCTMSDDEMLTAVMMHWMQGATPGLRYYKAAFKETGPTCLKKAFTTYVSTPMGVSAFPGEVACPPRDWIAGFSNVQFYRQHDVGGHFPIVECPDLWVRDVREWFGSDIVKSAMTS